MNETPIKEVKLPPIRNGTVIDHIACGQALNVMKILKVNDTNIDSSISIGMHVVSNKEEKWKDIIKIEDRELDEDHVVGRARCSNPNCITNRGEPVAPEFTVIGRHPPQLRCCYCDRLLTNISDNLL